MKDELGNFLIFNIKYFNIKYLLVVLYGLNEDIFGFFEIIFKYIEMFGNEFVVIGEILMYCLIIFVI